MDSFGSVKVIGLAAAELMAACTADVLVNRKSERVECGYMELFCTAAYLCKADASDTADRSREVFVDELL